jgi:hypothetical protein
MCTCVPFQPLNNVTGFNYNLCEFYANEGQSNTVLSNVTELVYSNSNTTEAPNWENGAAIAPFNLET